MPSITYISKCEKNTGLVISPEELLALYFYGIDIQSKDGSDMSNETIRFYIESAQQEIEKHLSIKLNPTFINETEDYTRADYTDGFPFTKVTYPVNNVFAYVGSVNGVDQVKYPRGWLSYRRSSENQYWRDVSVVPNGSMSGNAEIIYSGTVNYYGLKANSRVPDYWTIQYSTGYCYNSLPMDLMNIVGMLASIPLFIIFGDIAGGIAGLASQSLSIDGLSQSTSLTASATSGLFSARIIDYKKSIKETLSKLKKNYRGIGFATC